MPNGQATKRAEGRAKLTPEQWEHIRKSHITIVVNKEKDLIEIGWLTNCGEASCSTSHVTVSFYVCPKKPCPPLV
jgi:hypothetical protein